MYLDAASASNMIAVSTENRSKMREKEIKNNPWFDIKKECMEYKKRYTKAQNVFRRNETDQNRDEMIRKGKSYNYINRKKKQSYLQALHSDIRKLKSETPNDYWNIINKKDNICVKSRNLSVQDFLDILKT